MLRQFKPDVHILTPVAESRVPHSPSLNSLTPISLSRQKDTERQDAHSLYQELSKHTVHNLIHFICITSLYQYAKVFFLHLFPLFSLFHTTLKHIPLFYSLTLTLSILFQLHHLISCCSSSLSLSFFLFLYLSVCLSPCLSYLLSSRSA